MAHHTPAAAACIPAHPLADIIGLDELAAAVRTAFNTLVSLISDTTAPIRERRLAATAVIHAVRARHTRSAGDGRPPAAAQRSQPRATPSDDAVPEASVIQHPPIPAAPSHTAHRVPITAPARLTPLTISAPSPAASAVPPTASSIPVPAPAPPRTNSTPPRPYAPRHRTSAR